ncbi:MAG: hypothetical protein IJN17_05405 [Clostridia bacterium]|nr:hypothetical protein [Oscillospiraceae bacterium]MBQ6702374.1 hypothetical protein [Clostridia bacterium]
MDFKATFNHEFYPFKNQAEIDRVRNITYEDIVAMNGKHPNGNPNIKITVTRSEEFAMYKNADMLKRIIDSDRYDKKCVMIMPNPSPGYRQIAYMLKKLKVNCRNVKFYMMDEWADEDGNIAPLSYKAGFGNAFYRNMVQHILELGFKEENFIYHSNKTTPDYSKMLEQDGEADVVYSGPGWPGHMAFIDPVDDWFKPTMEEYLEQPAKVATLHPLTIAQNSLHGSFGVSGDISKVPPKGATMGPRDYIKAKNSIDFHNLSTAGTPVSWQRLTSRLCVFGEPSQEVPASIVQLRDKPTHIIFGTSGAATIKDDDYFQY